AGAAPPPAATRPRGPTASAARPSSSPSASSRKRRHRVAASGFPHWARLAVLTAGYVLAGKLGLLFASVHASATAVWPPTGIALAALLVLGIRTWPVVAIGAFLVNVTTAGSIATSLGIALGNTLEAVIGVWLVERFAHGRGAFERPRGIFAFA